MRVVQDVCCSATRQKVSQLARLVAAERLCAVRFESSNTAQKEQLSIRLITTKMQHKQTIVLGCSLEFCLNFVDYNKQIRQDFRLYNY